MSAGRAHPLARVPHPCPNEHPAGYIRRLAEANGFTTLRQLRLVHGLEPLSPRSEARSWQLLQRATGLDPTLISPLSWKPVSTGTATWLSVWGRPLRLVDLDLARLRICPACVAENDLIQAQWSIRHLTACPTHGVQLLDRCFACGNPALADTRTDVWSCGACGADRRDAVPPRADSGAVMLARAMSAAFHGTALVEVALPPDLLSLSVGSMAAVVARLAQIRLLATNCAQAGATANPHRRPPQMVEHATAQALAAADLLADWPNRYMDLLLLLADGAGETGSHRIGDRFRTAAGRLAVRPLRDVDGNDIAFLSNPTLSFCHDALGLVPRGRAPGASVRRRKVAPSLPPDPISHSAAMFRLEGRPVDRLARWWIEAGLLDEHVGTDGRATLSNTQVAELAVRIDAFEGEQPPGARPVGVEWVDRRIAAGRAYRKSDFLVAVAEGRFTTWRVSGRPGLAGLRFDAREIDRERSRARLMAWSSTDEHVSISRFNAEAVTFWDRSAAVDMETCDRLAAQGRLRMTYYEPPGPDSRRQKRWHAGDLIRHAQGGRSDLLGDADQVRRRPPAERRR